MNPFTPLACIATRRSPSTTRFVAVVLAAAAIAEVATSAI